MGSTRVDLVSDVELAWDTAPVRGLTRRKVERIAEIIRKAKLGYYTDFASPLPAPKIALHQDLLAAGLFDIDKKMQNGDYDNDE